ncbi:MAG: hypothetical protein CW338_03540 [Clostridiales bacterium]|nr:hypothetical protein [Clostridiales bacterium]
MYKRLSLCLLIALFALIFVTANSNAESLFSNSGSCGENAIWEYENGVLTITGVGAIDNCSEDSSPWYNIRDNIQSVIIEEGITSIGDYAFYRIDNLTSVSFPSTLECIGTEAFRSAKMESITLPNGLTQIGPSAFGWCTKLKSVDIPDSVVTIGASAFYCCTHLEKVRISPSISVLNKAVFGNTRVKEIIVPAGVTSIGERCFESCGDLVSIKIPVTVTSVEKGAFSGCKKLKEVHYEGTIDDARLIDFSTDNSEITSAKWFCGELYDEVTTAVSFMRVKVNNGSNVRSGPSSDYDKIAYADAGEIYDCLGEENGWYKIKLKDGSFGYIATSRCSVVD